jgi:hypothetical protein
MHTTATESLLVSFNACTPPLAFWPPLSLLPSIPASIFRPLRCLSISRSSAFASSGKQTTALTSKKLILFIRQISEKCASNAHTAIEKRALVQVQTIFG